MFVRLMITMITMVTAAMVSGLSPRAAAEDRAQSATAYFEKHVRPLLIDKCYSCHGAKKQEGGLRLDSRRGWAVGGDSGPAIAPPDAERSLLIRSLRSADPDSRMPPDKRLKDGEIAILEQWVRLGAPDPRGAVGPTGENEASNPADPVAGRGHWAFAPLNSRQPTDTSGAASTIDGLVYRRLRAANLHPAGMADRRILVRRLYVQTIGLPPTRQQVAKFLADGSPDAYERLVDQLLSSPRFGERWGRHWLDLARYADSNGLDENFLFREAWRYRNWVIASVNADTPYPRFIAEQIAGDLLPHSSIEERDRQRIAAGFLVIGPKVLLGNDGNERRMDVADEQINTIGRAILGQTLGCARCHDHKFDPFPTADYYALAGIMTSTQVMETRHMLGSQRLMEQLVGLGADGDKMDAAYEEYYREHKTLKERAKQAKAALDLLKKGDEKSLASLKTLRAEHQDAVDAAALDESQDKDLRLNAQQALLKKLAKAAIAPEIPPRAMIPSEGDQPADEAIRLAGRFDQEGETVPRGFLQVLSDHSAEISSNESGRLALSGWLTDPRQPSGRLAARVLANRVWRHLIGRGVVRTVDNFGRTGEPPSHPELLDYLAHELVESDWSLKALVRRILLSKVFQQSSGGNEAAQAVDPDNRLLWRAHRRRLEPEVLRDAMLQVAGELDLTPMDSSVWYLGDQATAVGANKNRRRTDFPCRSIYLPVVRNDLPELFEAFDFADPHITTGLRPETMAATQGLFLLNDESVMNAAESTAKRLLSAHSREHPDTLVDRAFELVLNDSPTVEDRRELIAFVQEAGKLLEKQGDKERELRAWSLVVHSLFASSRFQILE